MYSLLLVYRFALLITILLPAVHAQSPNSTSTSNSSSTNCDCYVVNSDRKTTYFSNHRFWDFRSIQDAAGYMNSTEWTNDWSVSPWAKNSSSASPLAMSNDLNNVYISSDNSSYSNATFLALQAYRLADLMSTAELQNNQQNMYYASVRVYARVNPSASSAGACAGVFTYHDDDNESDIEVLTKDTVNTWHLTNQPSVDNQGNVITAASVVPTDIADWTQWHEMRIDWLPTRSRWFVDGSEVANLTYSIPKKPSGLILNMWGDGGVWTGEMEVGGRAELQIQWVEMVFNTSGRMDGSGGTSYRRIGGRAAASSSCQTACTIDNVTTQGTPELFVQTASISDRLSGSTYSLYVWVSLAVAILVYL